MICWMKEVDISVYLCVILFKWSWRTELICEGQGENIGHPWWGPTSVLEMCGDNTHGNLLSCMFKISMLYCILYLSESEVAQSCPTLCDPMDCILSGSSVHGILQARTVEWVAISFSRISSRPRDQTLVSHTAGRLFTVWATRGSYILVIQNKVL